MQLGGQILLTSADWPSAAMHRAKPVTVITRPPTTDRPSTADDDADGRPLRRYLACKQAIGVTLHRTCQFQIQVGHFVSGQLDPKEGLPS
jgi:hypothetical protein